jgi:hypothetical protein
VRRLQEPVADLETDDHCQIDEQGSDQGGPTDRRAVKEVLNRPVQVCVKAGGVEHPESGKGETGDQIKPSAEKSHGAAFSGIEYRESVMHVFWQLSLNIEDYPTERNLFLSTLPGGHILGYFH